MNKQDALQYAKEEAEFLRKRIWDFLNRLEKLKKEQGKSIDAEKRRSLQIQIDNIEIFLENYKIEYKTMCEEAGIPSEIVGTADSDHDVVSPH
ncbi:MAG: hypothetical protein D3925_01630, partial [Candidatus Electrothrix sp. AR5]|nr:hypothetical protein [Candidatus Electrothrix sp. AR5]